MEFPESRYTRSVVYRLPLNLVSETRPLAHRGGLFASEYYEYYLLRTVSIH